MRTETYTITKHFYTWEEMTDAQKELAYNKNYDICSDTDFSDFENTLNTFCKIFGIKVYNWEVCSTSNYYRFSVSSYDYREDVEGLRLARWLWNNVAGDLETAKTYWTPGKAIDGKYYTKSRKSNVTKQLDNCPLTGFCFDMDILQPVIDCMTYKRIFRDFDSLMDTCLDKFFQAWQDDIAYAESFEAFEEYATANEWEFDDNGNIA